MKPSLDPPSLCASRLQPAAQDAPALEIETATNMPVDGSSSSPQDLSAGSQESSGAAKGESLPDKHREWTPPAWLNHFNPHDLKDVFRCWTAAWVAMLLIFINPALQNISVATFFGALVLFVAPPANGLLVYLLGMFSLLFGMCTAWLWGLVVMKVGFAVRSASQTQAMLLALKQKAEEVAKKTGQSPQLASQALIYSGFLLDARVTAVYYVLCCLYIYALARLRCSNPKFTITQIFGTIIMDLFLLFGPVLPSFDGSLGSILAKPGAVGAGLGVACSLIIFPQSTSFLVLHKMAKLIRMVDTSLQATQKRLANEPIDLAELQTTKGKLIATSKAADPDVMFLPLDFSRGRWNADDVKTIHGLVRDAVVASLTMIEFHINILTAQLKADEMESLRVAQNDDEPKGNEPKTHMAGRHQMQRSLDVLDALRAPEREHVRARTLATLKETTSQLLATCLECTELSAQGIHTVNASRWIHRASRETLDGLSRDMADKLADLQSIKATTITTTTEGILERFADIFNEDGSLRDEESASPASLRGIILSMVAEERILSTATALEKLLEKILELSETRTSNRIWIPSRLKYALSWVLNGKLSVPISGTTTDAATNPDSVADNATVEEQAVEARRRLRGSRAYYGRSAQRSPLNRAIVASFRWLFNPSGMYALRMVVVTIATAIPAAIPHSAGFFFREKGIWAVITAQTSLLVYMADLIFSVASRGIGTVIGGLMGTLAWYIGSGSGSGNPYGLAAILAVMVFILVWWRLFLPPAFVMAAILTCATFVLVIGFSYDQQHVQEYGGPGEGYTAFWKRLVTVLIGFAACVVVQIFPSPPSATRHVSKSLANTVRTLADHYALLLSHWGREGQASPLGTIAEQISLDVAENLQSLSGAIALLKVELSFTPFDQKVLKETQEQCQYMNQCLGRLLYLTSTLPTELQIRLADTAGLLDERMIGDVMAVLGIVEQSLRTGSPLPERLPAPLIRRLYETWHTQPRNAILSTSLVRDENYRRYCVAMSSYIKFLSSLDDLILVLKAALGECHIIFERDEV